MSDKEIAGVRIEGVEKRYPGTERKALAGVSLEVPPGSFFSILGPSGCGKTTLLRIINGLITPEEGTVTVMGGRPEPGPDLAMVFQSARLLPWRTVSGNIEFALAMRGHHKAERRQRALALLGAVGLRDFADAFPHQLSGGMQQRVGLARALAVEPKVLLMDEPFAALDAMTREVLRKELLQMWARRRMAIVFVTHDIDEAVYLSQRVVLLRPRPGRIDEVVEVNLPEPRWEHDPRPTPQFTALRNHLWDRIHAMARDGEALEELAAAFPMEVIEKPL
jgi:NitT/TauT family transport system ATP-binding protein